MTSTTARTTASQRTEPWPNIFCFIFSKFYSATHDARDFETEFVSLLQASTDWERVKIADELTFRLQDASRSEHPPFKLDLSKFETRDLLFGIDHLVQLGADFESAVHKLQEEASKASGKQDTDAAAEVGKKRLEEAFDSVTKKAFELQATYRNYTYGTTELNMAEAVEEFILEARDWAGQLGMKCDRLHSEQAEIRREASIGEVDEGQPLLAQQQEGDEPATETMTLDQVNGSNLTITARPICDQWLNKKEQERILDELRYSFRSLERDLSVGLQELIHEIDEELKRISDAGLMLGEMRAKKLELVKGLLGEVELGSLSGRRVLRRIERSETGVVKRVVNVEGGSNGEGAVKRLMNVQEEGDRKVPVEEGTEGIEAKETTGRGETTGGEGPHEVASKDTPTNKVEEEAEEDPTTLCSLFRKTAEERKIKLRNFNIMLRDIYELPYDRLLLRQRAEESGISDLRKIFVYIYQLASKLPTREEEKGSIERIKHITEKLANIVSPTDMAQVKSQQVTESGLLNMPEGDLKLNFGTNNTTTRTIRMWLFLLDASLTSLHRSLVLKRWRYYPTRNPTLSQIALLRELTTLAQEFWSTTYHPAILFYVKTHTKKYRYADFDRRPVAALFGNVHRSAGGAGKKGAEGEGGSNLEEWRAAHARRKRLDSGLDSDEVRGMVDVIAEN